MYVSAHIIVSGIVQGVGFRYFVYTHANKLGLSGYVANLYNGDVEIVVEGKKCMIEELIKEVRIGPRFARVSDIKVEWKEADYKYKKFYIQ